MFVLTPHLVIRWLISITHQAHTLGTTRIYPKVSSSIMTHAQLELLFMALVGWAQYPSQSLLRSTEQPSLRASTETTTMSSRRWQPPRGTSTIGLQLDHLVPLHAISWCNHTRITFTLNHMITIKHMWVRDFSNQAHKMAAHPQGAQPQPSLSSASTYSPQAK